MTYFGLKVTYNMFITLIQVSCTNVLNIPKTYGYITAGECSFNFVVKTFTFLILLHQMYHFHRFEFKRTSKALLIYFLLDIFSFGLTIYIFTLERLGKTKNAFMLFCYLVNLPQILIGYAVLYLKDSKDVL